MTLGLAVVACGPGEESFVTTKPPVATVSVDMDSFTMKPSQATAPKGPVKFIARNIHAKDVHELAVLRIRPDGTKQNAGEVEDLDAGATGEIVLDLPAGKYELACLIAKGEAGSLVGHYEAGMHVPFEVR
ncbi:MAG: hypothetical protein WC273_01820 [Dehalococcoidia bacterium]